MTRPDTERPSTTDAHVTRLAVPLSVLLLMSGAAGCALTRQADDVEQPKKSAPPPPPALVVAEEFGPLVYEIDPKLRPKWDQVLELHDRLFTKEGRTVEEDDLHRLYNEADTNDDDVLDASEIEEAFRRMKRDYERFLTRGG